MGLRRIYHRPLPREARVISRRNLIGGAQSDFWISQGDRRMKATPEYRDSQYGSSLRLPSGVVTGLLAGPLLSGALFAGISYQFRAEVPASAWWFGRTIGGALLAMERVTLRTGWWTAEEPKTGRKRPNS